ncbi:helix-hairpin-helix domain-containing protein [Paenarthrobacter nitroguajacolicus]|uniref:helix-hairpin-helix domain-containing protein n=1 Tax=Paenarthrobacter nitroguajacolicus TaxID=211146 RepID=UPI00248AAB9A|nr:helix-hairpin-helix domain-containing protein [Paenarthrobacter nitroguajacolicus]
MPRRNRDVSPDAAARAARERFASRMIPDHARQPLLELSDAEDPGEAGEELESFFAGQTTSSPSGARLRWRTSWRVAALLAVMGAVLIAWYFWQLSDGQPTSEPLNASAESGSADGSDSTGPDAGQPPSSSAPLAEGGPGVVVVHVAGAVNKPGVVSLPQGSRVFQAIDAVGGVAPGADLTSLNLAEVLTDGTKLYIPVAGEAPLPAEPSTAGAGAGSASTGGTSGPAAAGAKVNINTASLEELGTLPRIGPVTAQRILDWRKEHGAFTSVDELDAVDGIGPKLMESLKDLVTVQGG